MYFHTLYVFILLDDFTIVTALFDLNRENWPYFQRDFNTYLKNSLPLLSMDLNIIAFVEEKSRRFVEDQRKGKENKTYIYSMDFTDLELYNTLDEIKAIMGSKEFKNNHELIKHPEGFSPEYNILMNSKFFLMHKAAQMNIFNTSFFYWMDMGYGHGVDIFPKGRRWAPMNLMSNSDDKVTYIMVQWLWQIGSLLDVYKHNVNGLLCGGFFGGSSKAIHELYRTHKSVFRTCLNHGVVDDDQTIIIGCVHKNINLFNLVPGDWFDVFKLFH